MSSTHLLPDLDPDSIAIRREIRRCDASSIFEIELHGKHYAMKVYLDNGDPGIAKNGRDLNRFRCEFKAYQNLRAFGVCELGLVPYYYGHIEQLDPARFEPHLSHFEDDKYQPKAIILEYLSDPEDMNCVNYSEARWQRVMEGMKKIHEALVIHYDVYPKNVVLVPGDPERVIWIDFDVSISFPNKEVIDPKDLAYLEYEDELVENFGELLQKDQREGLPPNTKFY